MSQPEPTLTPASGDPVTRVLAGAALAVALVALVFAMTGVSSAHRDSGATAAAKKKAAKKKLPGASTKPRPYGILRLSKRKLYPLSVIPTVRSAKNASRLQGASRSGLTMKCPPESVDLKTWCMASTLYSVPTRDRGRNDYFYASRACEAKGGYLPSAAELLGAAARVKLSGKLDDSALTAAIDESPSDGLSDAREMSSTLITTTSGSTAAGTLGVTAGSKGNPRVGEPDPVPVPADPEPDTLQYVSVYDNHDNGGFAGGVGVDKALAFRCAYNKAQGSTVNDLD